MPSEAYTARLREQRRSVRPPTTTLETREKIRRLYRDEGLSATQLMERFGLCRESVWRIIRSTG